MAKSQEAGETYKQNSSMASENREVWSVCQLCMETIYEVHVNSGMSGIKCHKQGHIQRVCQSAAVVQSTHSPHSVESAVITDLLMRML